MRRTENLLIGRLPSMERHRLLARCEPYELTSPGCSPEPAKPAAHAYFPASGCFSLVIDWDRYPRMEVAMIGRESVLGGEILLGDHAPPWQAVAHGQCQGWRIGATALADTCASSPSLRVLLHTALLVRWHQQALALACQRLHAVGPRLARWLLMCHDRTPTEPVHMTQEALAGLLGVRRVGVTLAASELQQSGLIHYHRGAVTVIDRAALALRACRCYRADLALHRKLLPGPVP